MATRESAGDRQPDAVKQAIYLQNDQRLACIAWQIELNEVGTRNSSVNSLNFDIAETRKVGIWFSDFPGFRPGKSGQ